MCIRDRPNTLQQNSVASSPNANNAQQVNDRVFLFAKESLDMIAKLTTVFNEQLAKAESWVGGEAAESEVAVEEQEKEEDPDISRFNSNQSTLSWSIDLVI